MTDSTGEDRFQLLCKIMKLLLMEKNKMNELETLNQLASSLGAIYTSSMLDFTIKAM